MFDLIRDLAVVAAAAGVAWWCWDQYRTSTERRDDAARSSLTAERQSADLKQWAEKLDERTGIIAAQLAQLAQMAQLSQGAQAAHVALLSEVQTARTIDYDRHRDRNARDEDARMASKVAVHRLLHSTTDPFLTFVEIERALGNVGQLAGQVAAREDAEEQAPLAGDRLRRVLIGLVADGVVAQLDRDRYFIASDYETDHQSGDEDGNHDDDGDATA